jgi:hypothetical protein
VENRSTPSDEGVSSKLVSLAKHCKDRYLCGLVLKSSLLDRSIRSDGGRFTLLQAASAYNVTSKLAELDLASFSNAERRSAVLVALRHGSLEAAKQILGLRSTRHFPDPSHGDLAFGHPLDILTWALRYPQMGDYTILEAVLQLGVAKFVTYAKCSGNDEGSPRSTPSPVNHDLMKNLVYAPVNAESSAGSLLSLIFNTAIIEGHFALTDKWSSGDPVPEEKQLAIFRTARRLWLYRHWGILLPRLHIAINKRCARCLSIPHRLMEISEDGMSAEDELNKPLDVRPLIAYMAGDMTVSVEDHLRAAVKQGKAFRLYGRDKTSASD